MTRYQPGDTVRFVLDTTQPGPPAVRVDADTVALTVTDPDGVAHDYAIGTGVVHSGLGAYYHDHTLIATAGTTTYRWNAVGTDPFPWTVVEGDQVYARPPGARLLSLDEAKAAMKYKPSSDTGADDDLIEDLIDTVTERIEAVCGPVIPRNVTDTIITGYRQYSTLRQWPVISLVSLDGDDDPDGALASITLLNSGEVGEYRTLYGNYPWGGGQLVYRVGRDPVPAGIRDAAREWIKHRVRGGIQRSAASPGTIMTTDDYQARDDSLGSTHGIPLEVVDSLRPYLRPGML